MTIGYDASRAFLKDKTGTENYSYQLLKNLAKIDSDSIGPDNIGTGVDTENNYLIYLRPSSVIPAPNFWPKNFKFVEIKWPRFWTQGGLALQTFKDKLDILFIPAHTIPLIYKSGTKTVVTVHDLGSEYLPQMHKLKQRFYLSFMQRIQLKMANKIIAVSKATKNDLVKKIGIDSGKIEVIYEGFDRQLFRPVKGDILNNILNQFRLEKYGYFLFVGTVQPRKNLTKLIQAFKQFCHPEEAKRPKDLKIKKAESIDLSLIARDDNIKLVIAGSKGWLSDEIYALPKKLGIEDKVKFLGRVSDQDLPTLYSGAIALIFPSLFEGFGLPIIEAQACGCPVITSNISSMPEVAGKGAILVNPYSEADIVRGVREVGEVRGKLIKAGFENIKRFSWEKCATQTLEVLNSL